MCLRELSLLAWLNINGALKIYLWDSKDAQLYCGRTVPLYGLSRDNYKGHRQDALAQELRDVKWNHREQQNYFVKFGAVFFARQ